jgi:uncharacterized surface protein with fasciclin (FAS1) repeats
MQLLFTFFVFLTSTLTFIMAQEEKLLYEPNAPDYKPNPTCSIDNPQSLFDKLAPDPALSTFMDVLTQMDDIFQLLNDTTTPSDTVYTVFCPVNSAFRNELDVYTREHLKEFLMNHIVPSNKIIDPESLKRIKQPLKTLLPGQTIQVSHHFFSKRTLLNDHAMVDTDHYVQAVNGIAYKIDHLLRPTT